MCNTLAAVGEAKYSKRGHGRAPASPSQAQSVPATRAQGQGAGLNHAWRELPELVSLHTAQLGRGGVLAEIAVWRTR
jgi:hypothetical protein